MSARKARWLQFTGIVLLAWLAATLARADDLLIGQVSSQTSPVTAMNAKGLYAGFNVYLEYVNAQGGVNGRKVKLVNKDDQLAAPKMIELTKEFAADKNVVALAAYQNTGGITALAKENVVGQLGLALIAPFQGDKSIVSAPNFYPFRTGYPDEVAAMVKEAVFQQKKRVVIAYQSATFGPSMMKIAKELAAKEKLNIVAEVVVETAQADKIDASVKEAGAAIAKAEPDAVFLLIGGRAAPLTVGAIKATSAEDAQIYGMSILPAAEVYKAAGDKARGIVITQAVPFPFSATLPVVSQYQKLMKQYAPNEALSFTTLEGFIAAKITVEAIKRAGPSPTREKVLKALNGMGQLDLGGVYVDYSPKQREGWGGVDLTVIGANGKLLR
jgi:ABC-type branched-subunit amino acid transport system substrate-binding protein